MDEWMDGWMDGWLDGWSDGWMDEWMDGCGQGGCQMGDRTDSYLVEQQMTSAEVVKQVMAVTVVTLLKVAMEIMWSAILLGVELSCEMIGIADQEGTMQHSDCMTIASVTVPEPKMRMLCFDDEIETECCTILEVASG